MMFARCSSRCKKRSIKNLICSMNDSSSPLLGLISTEIDAVPRQARADYTCFLACFDPAEPVTGDQQHDTPQGGKPQVQRAQREKGPSAPCAEQMTGDKTGDAQAE